MKRLSIIVPILAILLAGGCRQDENQNQPSENQVIETIMARRSIRKYQDRAVEREKLQQIAECGVNAPNGMNAQKWEVRIVDNPEYINGVSEIFKKANPEMVERDPNFKNMFRNAPAIICVGAQEGLFTQIDCGLMGENMMLAACSLGLGTCCLAGPVGFLVNNPEARPYYEALRFSEGYSLLYIIAVGYPDEAPEAKPRDLSKILFVD